MTLTLILAAVLGVTVLGMLGWRRCSHTLAMVTLFGFLAIACGPVPKLLLPALQKPYAIRPATDWAPSNTIVLLTAGASFVKRDEIIEPSSSAFARITGAVVLYRDCKRSGARCTLLVSGGDADQVGEPLAVTYSRTLLQLGVPVSDTVLETRSMDTWQNAEFARPLLQAIGAQRVWLVTSGVHLRRAMLCFEHFGIHPTPMRADYQRGYLSSLPAATNIVVTDSALHEIFGIAALYLYEKTGWSVLV
jgi:uncharacterized SAM-binding protein YcdF (DUF218 family)